MEALHEATVALEPAQFASARAQALPRRALGRVTLGLLILLRGYVLLVIPVVVYAFIHALNAAPPRP